MNNTTDTAIRLSSGDVSVVVMPNLGAQITSLSIGATEWVAQPLVEPEPVEVGAAFVRDAIGGWDEMLPTISGAIDHGEVWARAWTVDKRNATSLTTSIKLETSPLRLQRCIDVTARGVDLSYRLERIALAASGVADEPDEAIGALWAAHPLLRAVEIEFPTHVSGLLDVMPEGVPVDHPPWIPIDQAVLRISDLEVGKYAKYYVPFGVPISSVIVRNAAGEALEWSWSSEIKYFGVWIDRGFCGPGEVIAPEPTNAAWDDLALAERLGMVPMLQVGDVQTWTISVKVHPSV